MKTTFKEYVNESSKVDDKVTELVKAAIELMLSTDVSVTGMAAKTNAVESAIKNLGFDPRKRIK